MATVKPASGGSGETSSLLDGDSHGIQRGQEVLCYSPGEDSPPTPPGGGGEGGATAVYARRWYILALFSLLAFTQGGVWNTWGPIASSVEPAFGWSDADVGLLTNWGPITYVVSTLFFTWMMDVKGLRWSCVTCGALLFCGTGLRCLTTNPRAAIWLLHAGQIVNGLAGPVLMGAPPLISATWFPVSQRTTATSIAVAVTGLGVASSFLLGPLIVGPGNTTDHPNNSAMADGAGDPEFVRHRVLLLMYIEWGWAALLFVLVLAYFPAKPPQPPSVTATLQRVDYKEGLRQIVRHEKFWMLGIVYGLSGGVFNCWCSVLDVNLKAVGIHEDTAGYVGFAGVVVGNSTAVLIAFFADHFTRRFKVCLITLYAVGSAAFLLFALEYIKVIPLSVGGLYATMVVGSVCVVGAVPLLFELVCEATYPIAEGLTNGLMTWLNNLAGLVFLLVLYAPIEDLSWMNWTMFGCTVACVPFFIAYRERYSRLDIDTGDYRPLP